MAVLYGHPCADTDPNAKANNVHLLTHTILELQMAESLPILVVEDLNCTLDEAEPMHVELEVGRLWELGAHSGLTGLTTPAPHMLSPQFEGPPTQRLHTVQHVGYPMDEANAHLRKGHGMMFTAPCSLHACLLMPRLP